MCLTINGFINDKNILDEKYNKPKGKVHIGWKIIIDNVSYIDFPYRKSPLGTEYNKWLKDECDYEILVDGAKGGFCNETYQTGFHIFKSRSKARYHLKNKLYHNWHSIKKVKYKDVVAEDKGVVVARKILITKERG